VGVAKILGSARILRAVRGILPRTLLRQDAGGSLLEAGAPEKSANCAGRFVAEFLVVQ
jgi:hypothetical protein